MTTATNEERARDAYIVAGDWFAARACPACAERFTREIPETPELCYVPPVIPEDVCNDDEDKALPVYIAWLRYRRAAGFTGV